MVSLTVPKKEGVPLSKCTFNLENAEVPDVLRQLDEISQRNLTECTNYLIEVLKCEERDIVREAIVETLKQLDDESISDKIVELFESDDAFLRNSAVTILSHRWRMPLESLSKSLRHKNKHVRKLALDALHSLGNPISVDIIALALDDEDINNVIAAVEYIGNLEGYKYAEKIVKIMSESEDPFLTATCLETLSKIGNKYLADVVQRMFPDPLKLEDFILAPYLKFIAAFGNTSHIDTILEVGSSKLKLFCKEIVDAIQNILQRETTNLPPELRQRLHDFLSWALNQDVPSNNKYEIVLLIADIGAGKVSNLLKKLLFSADPLVRLGAIEVVGQLKMREFVKDLEILLKSELNEDVRYAIEDVLSRLTGR